MLCAGLATAGQAATSLQAPAKTVIDGRTFDFPVPDANAPDFYKSIHKEFLIGALNTPSPPRQIWEPFGKLMDMDEARNFVANYLKSRPAPDKAEMKAFLARIKGNMIFVKGGTFDMGDYGWLTPAHRPMTDTSGKDTPHKVTLSSYSLMKNWVTYAEYDVYTRANHLGPMNTGVYDVTLRYPDYPVLTSWEKARNFCLWVGKVAGKPIDLDTSAQYEYAARSGGKWLLLASTYEKPDELVPDLNRFHDEMYAKGERVSADSGVTVPIGTYGPNYLGFEDMIGPVEEWVYDWYAHYTKKPLTNPHGPATGTEKVVRTPNYDGRGTINRWKHKPDYSYGAFRCAINSTRPWP
jgi:formylglycine-generating enzyme required for sulfatase activity